MALNDPAGSVTEALETRLTLRAFRPDPVPEDTVREILEVASRAASGGNLQPWKVYVLTGAARDALVADVLAKFAQNPTGEGADYHIYPPDLTDPYEARRRDVGRKLYEHVGIDRKDQMARLKQTAENFRFFGAPVGMFFSIDRQMNQPQFVDLGLFMQSIMLLAREKGLHTAPQEAWAIWTPTITKHLGLPDHEMLFCGLALGYADEDAAINHFRSPRVPVDAFTTFIHTSRA